MGCRPYVRSELVGDALELAIAARVVDMRASPYDLRSVAVDQCGLDVSFGLEPIRVETAAGRAEYREETMAISRRAEPLRAQLIRAASEALS